MVASRYIFWVLLAVPGLFALHGCGGGEEEEDNASANAATTDAATTVAATTTMSPADVCHAEYMDVGGKFNSCNPDEPSTCEDACTSFEAWDQSCSAETFDGLGLTDCECDCDVCDCDNCPAESTIPVTKESIVMNVLYTCGKCSPAYSAIAESCGDDSKDTCAAYQTFQDVCTEEEWAMMDMWNCDCEDCDTENCPEENRVAISLDTDLPALVRGCNNDVACSVETTASP